MYKFEFNLGLRIILYVCNLEHLAPAIDDMHNYKKNRSSFSLNYDEQTYRVTNI